MIQNVNQPMVDLVVKCYNIFLEITLPPVPGIDRELKHINNYNVLQYHLYVKQTGTYTFLFWF